MPKYTSNYNLVKPLPTELYDINTFNENVDKIDKELALTKRFTQTVQSGTDLNTVTESGFYRLNSNHPNSPKECYYGQLLVLHGGGDTIGQILMNYTDGSLWARGGNPSDVSGNGTWHEWKKLSNTKDVPGQLLYNKYTLETTSGGSELDDLLDSVIATMDSATMRCISVHDSRGYSALTGGTSFITIYKYNNDNVVLSAFKYGGAPSRIRTKVSGVWGNWQSVYTNLNPPPVDSTITASGTNPVSGAAVAKYAVKKSGDTMTGNLHIVREGTSSTIGEFNSEIVESDTGNTTQSTLVTSSTGTILAHTKYDANGNAIVTNGIQITPDRLVAIFNTDIANNSDKSYLVTTKSVADYTPRLRYVGNVSDIASLSDKKTGDLFITPAN